MTGRWRGDFGDGCPLTIQVVYGVLWCYMQLFVILKNPLLSLRYLKTLLYYSLLIQHMVQNEED